MSSRVGHAAASSSHLTGILREWDNASRTRRLQILTDFLIRHRQSTAAEIETDLGHGSLLFFTRITAWLRLTYRLGQELAVPLSALSLFIQGQRYLTNFTEIGGIQMLTELVSLSGYKHPLDKENALLLLIHIANAGRVYREMICDADGVKQIAAVALDGADDRILELFGSLFTALGQGNPRKASKVHAGLLYIMRHGSEGGALAAATALRSLQLTKMAHGGGPNFGSGSVTVGGDDGGGDAGADVALDSTGTASGGVLDAVFHIVQSPNVKLRFEGMELLTIAAHNPQLHLPVLRRCFEALEHADITIDEDPTESSRVERLKSSCGRVICTILQMLHPSGRGSALGSWSGSTDETSERVFALVQRHSGHITLCQFLVSCAGRDVPGQIECCRALRLLVIGPYGQLTTPMEARTHSMGAWVAEACGDALFAELLASELELSEAFAVSITAAIADSFQRAKASAPDASASGGPVDCREADSGAATV